MRVYATPILSQLNDLWINIKPDYVNKIPYEYQNCFNINESYTDFRTQTILMDHVSLWHT